MTAATAPATARIVAVSGAFTGLAGIAYGPASVNGLGEHRTLVRFDNETGAIPVLTSNLRFS